MANYYLPWRIDEIRGTTKSKRTGRLSRIPRNEGNAVSDAIRRLGEASGAGLELAGRRPFEESEAMALGTSTALKHIAKGLKGSGSIKGRQRNTESPTWEFHPANPDYQTNVDERKLRSLEMTDRSGITGEGQTKKVRANQAVDPGAKAEELSDVNEVKKIEEDAKSKIVEEGENDGNQSVLTEWTTDQDVNEEATIIPGSEMAVSKEDNKQYQEDIVDKPSETPKAEVKDGPFSSAANTFNTVNSMIKGLSTIMANMNPDAQSVAFADPTDYFKNKKALEDWRKRMYGSQVRA